MKRIDSLSETNKVRAELPPFSQKVYDAINAEMMDGEPFYTSITGEDIALALGTTAQAVGGAIAHLQDAGLAYTCESDVNGQHYMFLDTYAHNGGFSSQIDKTTKASKKETTKKEGNKMDAKEQKIANQKHQADAREKLAQAGKKQCTICGKVLPLTDFHNDKQKKDGHSSWCKPCTKIKATQAAGASKVTRKAAPVTKKAEAKPATDPTKAEKAEAKRIARNAAAKAKRDAAREMREAAMAAQDR